MTLTHGSLFTGYGGLDMAVEAVTGARTVWHAEYEPPTEKVPNPKQAGARLLAHRYPGVPNHGDVTAIDWANIEPVDIISGGSPCQDVSAAGRRAGMRAGTRSGLWTSMVTGISIIRPRLVVWENVRGVLSADADSSLEPCPGCMGDGHDVAALRALGRVLGDLADIGYDASWYGLSASDIGAPHGRFREFVAAWPAADPNVPRPQGSEPARRYQLSSWRADADASCDGRDEGWPEPARLVGGPDAALSSDDATAHANGDALRQQPVTVPGRGGTTVPRLARANAVADAERGRRDGRAFDAIGQQEQRAAVAWGRYEPAVRRWERLTRPAPLPWERGPKGGYRLAPAFSEWMMGIPAGHVTDVPGLTRNEQLKLIGNGVVPQQGVVGIARALAVTPPSARDLMLAAVESLGGAA